MGFGLRGESHHFHPISSISNYTIPLSTEVCSKMLHRWMVLCLTLHMHFPLYIYIYDKT